MSQFVKLTLSHGGEVWVNLGRVTTMRRLGPSPETTLSNARPERTRLELGGGNFEVTGEVVEVLETPEQILAVRA